MSDRHYTSQELYLRLLSYVRPYWRIFAIGTVALVLTAATEPLFPALMKPLLDKGFSGQQRSDLWIAPLAIIGIFLLRGIFGYISSYAMAWISNRVIADLRNLMFQRIIALPAAYFDATPSSRLITRVVHDIVGVSAAATNVITTVVKDSLTIVGLLGWLLYLNWRLTLVMLVLFPLTALVIRAFSKRLRAMNRQTQTITAHVTQVLQEGIDAQKVIKIYGGEEQERSRFSRISNELRHYYMKQIIPAAGTVPIIQLLAATALAIVIYIALLQSTEQHITVGSFVSFVTAMLMLLAPLKHLSDVNAPLQRGLVSAESVFTLLDERAEEDLGKREIARAEGRIVFAGVGFRYPAAERNALSDVDLAIEPGQTVALVGASGSGKTTLANLLPRFHKPDTGHILLDGIDIQELRLTSLRANLALVSQDVVLFDDTVAANIAYGGQRHASRQAVEDAARAANAHEFIAALPNGYDTMIGENGMRLSGGQRQRLAIARALLKDAPVLILDEATSALDSESERQVQAALERLMSHRTTLVIAHRLSTIERADRIVVLDQGRIIETGTHAELLARQGAYAHLHKLQFAKPAGEGGNAS
jgi:subfamily B ATP-binding cassette protein MsbA